MYRVLALDGGGIRAVFATTVLARLEEALPGVLARAQLLAGTSSGAITACALAAGVRPQDLTDIFLTQGPRIFDDSWLDDLRDLGGLAGAEYGSEQLHRILTEIFEETLGVHRLGDLERRVLVPAFDLDDGDDPAREPGKPRSWKPKFFHNFPGPGGDADAGIVDVLMRSCAGPVYFPTYDGYVDGGIIANNPAMAALAQARNPATGSQALEDIRLLSIGTGQSAAFVPGKHLDWGYVRWAKLIVRLVIDGATSLATYQCEQLLGSHFHRVDAVFDWPMALDEWRKAPQLKQIADELPLDGAVAWARRHFAARSSAATA